MHACMLMKLRRACAGIDGGNTVAGVYELNTTDLTGCSGGSFVITAVFSDENPGEVFGDSAGTTTITVRPYCPPVRPCASCPVVQHACMGIARPLLTTCCCAVL